MLIVLCLISLSAVLLVLSLQEQPCHYKESDNVAQDTGVIAVANGDERLLKWAVATFGPVAVAIDVPPKFMDYTDGRPYDAITCIIFQSVCLSVIVTLR